MSPRRLKPSKKAPARQKKRVAKPRRRPAADRAAADVQFAPLVRLVTRDTVLKVPADLLEEVSIFWSYVVRTRDRWSTDDKAYDSLASEIRQRLSDWDVADEALDRLASADLVEVQIPADEGDRRWAARLPWESLIAAATHPNVQSQGGKRPVVVRHLVSNQAPVWREPRKLLFVQSAPGPLSEFYEFDEERKIVESNSGLKPLPAVKDPTHNGLRARIAADRPDVVHLTGIDLHQGAALMRKPRKPDVDGIYLAGDGAMPDTVTAATLGELFAIPRPPVLAACNLYHSSSIAEEFVRHGVAYAIGFQDELDDVLIERFFGAFYRALHDTDWDIVAAFGAALAKTSGHASSHAPLRGSGIVLWSALPFIGNPRITPKPKKAVPARPVGPKRDGSDARDFFAIDVKPPKEINYSLLHNGEKIFEKFTITKLWPGPAEINVEVQLFAGQETFPYRTSVTLSAEQEFIDLAKVVHAPLLSRFLRSNRDAVGTCLYVEVRYGNVELKRDTFPLRILAVNEWKFDPADDSRWLASFILERDPAVARVINAAQRYVAALRDDVGSGFDGYQAIEPGADDPEAAVDLQVRAIWSALISDLPLSYINPPPTFTENSQRLRTPSDTVNGQRGTCIDLALLFAACLEYVEIYPVIFVLKDHAFPGYWRNPAHHAEFLEMKDAIKAGQTAKAQGDRSLDEFDEVTQLVNSGKLVPLETVWLTRRLSFQEAVDAGFENLINRSDFGALLDVVVARKKGVTPLPLIGENA